MENIVILSPGAGEFAKEVADKIKVPYENLRKSRNHKTQSIKIYPPKMKIGGKEVIILDDISSSGGTILGAINVARRNDSLVRYVAIPHLMTCEGISKICDSLHEERAVSKVVTTDSLDSSSMKHFMHDNYVELSTASLFSDYMKKLQL